MEDESELYPELLLIQCEKAIEVVDKENEAYNELINSFQTNIINCNDIDGKAADSLKEYASDFIMVLKYLIEANERDKTDYNALMESVQTVLADKVDIDEILIGIEIHNKIIEIENSIQTYLDLIESFEPDGAENLLYPLYKGKQNDYKDQIEDLERELQEWKNKEERYDTIELETASLFSITSDIRGVAFEAFSEMEDSFNSNIYNPIAKTGWKDDFFVIKIKEKYPEVYSYLINKKFSNKEIAHLYELSTSVFEQLKETLRFSERDAETIINKVLEGSFGYKYKVLKLPVPGDVIKVSYGTDAYEDYVEVDEYNAWSIQYSIEGCNSTFKGKLCCDRFNKALSMFEYNVGEQDLIKFSVPGYEEPVFAGAMVEGYANIGDIVNVTLDDGSEFKFMILDVKNTKHKKADLDNKQIQCKYGHGYMSAGKVQLSICEFNMSERDEEENALETPSGKSLEGKYVKETKIIDHVDID